MRFGAILGYRLHDLVASLREGHVCLVCNCIIDSVVADILREESAAMTAAIGSDELDIVDMTLVFLGQERW